MDDFLLLSEQMAVAEPRPPNASNIRQNGLPINANLARRAFSFAAASFSMF
jgi:hypothetical protein